MLKELLISSPPPAPILLTRLLQQVGVIAQQPSSHSPHHPAPRLLKLRSPRGKDPIPPLCLTKRDQQLLHYLSSQTHLPPPPAPLFCLGTVQETPGAAKEQQQCPGHQCEVGATGWQPALLVVGSQAWTDLHVGSRKAADQLLRVSSYVQGDKTLGNKAS